MGWARVTQAPGNAESCRLTATTLPCVTGPPAHPTSSQSYATWSGRNGAGHLLTSTFPPLSRDSGVSIVQANLCRHPTVGLPAEYNSLHGAGPLCVPGK